MENVYIHELVKAVRGEFLLGDPHNSVRNISIDTRIIRSGDFYFAIVGKNYDGHDFLKQAIEKKAGGLIISKNDMNLGNPFPHFPAIIKVADTRKALIDLARYYRRRWNIPMVAVTGSNGKTTTKEMLASIANTAAPVIKNEGNFNNDIGVPMTLFKITSDHRFGIIELGTSGFGEIALLSEMVAPNGAVITNIGKAHLETFKTQQGVCDEKRTVINYLPQNGWVCLNNDDKYLKELQNSVNREIVTFGINEPSDITASNITSDKGKPVFDLKVKAESCTVKLPVYGAFNIYNALAAAAASSKLGFDLESIRRGLENYESPGMRMQLQELPSGAVVLNDAYNANPSSIRESIRSFNASFPGRKQIIVLGDMLELGESAEPEHAALGDFISEMQFHSVLLFGQLMGKTFLNIKNKQAKHFMDKENLKLELNRRITPDCAVLLKASRGMHMEDILDRAFFEKE